jgi:hypothetical protein
MPVYKQFGSLDGNGTNQLTRTYFPSRIALVFAHRPRNQCAICIPPHRVHRCRTEVPIIIQPSLQDGVEFLDNVLQTYLRALALDCMLRNAGRFPVEVELGHMIQWQFPHLIRLLLEVLTLMFPLREEIQLVGKRLGGISSLRGLLMLFAAAVAPAKPDEWLVGTPAQTARQFGAFGAFHDVCFPTGHQCRQTPASAFVRATRSAAAAVQDDVITARSPWCSLYGVREAKRAAG